MTAFLLAVLRLHMAEDGVVCVCHHPCFKAPSSYLLSLVKTPEGIQSVLILEIKNSELKQDV